MVNKRLDKTTLISAAVISALIFISGIAIGTTISDSKNDLLRNRIGDVNSDVESFQLEFLLLDTVGENATCPLLKSRINDVNRDTYELGQRIVSFDENSRFAGDSEVEALKTEYYRSLIRYWLINKKVEDVCSDQPASVLYFFDADCGACDDQAVVLDFYKDKLGDDLLVFTLNADVQDPFIQTMVQHFNVTRYPTVVVDGEKHEGFRNRTALGDALCERDGDLSTCNGSL